MTEAVAAAEYGIDAPGVRRGLFLAGCAGAVVGGIAATVAVLASGATSTAAAVLAAAAALAAAHGFGMALYMTAASRVGKLRTRERLLDRVQALLPWTGREAVLDVGCGRGLMLIGAARRLTSGLAVGVDLWRAEDQAGNGPGAALENARREGVADRIRVGTADARSLPFADACFDAVLSHWVVHNIPEAADRMRALDEMLRVLRPGGVLVLADIAHHAQYRAYLENRGLAELEVQACGPSTGVVGLLSGGTFRPKVLIGRRS